MPLGNPIQAQGQRGYGGGAGASRSYTGQPWTPTSNYGGGAGQILTNPWGAKTTRPKGAPMPQGTGQFGFGQDPFTGYSPQSKKESDEYMDPKSPTGQLLQQRIENYRRELMKKQQQ